jgi:esterase/lipase superfamily enzyme
MVERGVLPVFRSLGRLSALRRALRWLGCALVLSTPAAALAQSADLIHAYQHSEAAKAAGRVQEALQYGEEALQLATAERESQGLDELLHDLGDLAAQSGDDERAAGYYARALSLQEGALGRDHPDLIPALTALADLRLKNKRYDEAEALELRILDIERKAYGEHHINVTATLGKIEEIYRATGNTEGVARVEAQLHASLASRGFPGPVEDLTRPAPKDKYFATVRVFYGTDRKPTGDSKPALYYGTERGDLQYGYLDVTIPTAHKEAALETQPRWAEYIFDAGETRSRYILLDKVVPRPKKQFVRELRDQIKDARSRDVFLFVHGFNNTFEDSARRAAQLVYDMDFDGTPLLYSWPSRGSPMGYAADESSVNDSGLILAEFLQTIISESGARRVHVLAHSMGSRALIEGVRTYLATRAPGNRKHIFGQMMFAAPDVDRSYFLHAVRPLEAAAERITLYASDNDYALRGSQLFHEGARAGTAGATIIRLSGLDTIDMSSVPSDLLGHSYFAANSGAIFDLFRLLWRGDPPPQRCGMSDRGSNGPFSVWVFNASACNGLDLLEAGVLLKRFGRLAQQRLESDLAALTDPEQKQRLFLVMQRLDRLQQAIAGPVQVVGK